jgi:hypothetical protein
MPYLNNPVLKKNRDREPLVEIMDQEDLTLGQDGEILVKLLKEKRPVTYQSLLKSKEERESLSRSINLYVDRMVESMGTGLNQAEAKEIHWPELCQHWGFR